MQSPSLIRISFILMIVLFQSKTLICQSKKYSPTFSFVANGGFPKVFFESYHNHEAIGITQKFGQGSKGIGIGIQRNFNAENSFGLKFEFQKSKFDDENQPAFKQCYNQHVLLYFSKESIPLLSSSNYFYRLYAGVSNSIYNGLNPFMFSYTTPFTYNSIWIGELFGADIGGGFGFKNWSHSMQLAVSLRIDRKNLIKTYRSFDKEEYKSKGFIHGIFAGVEMGFVFGKKIEPVYKKE